VTVFHPLDAHLYLVGVGHGIVHPLVFEAASSCLFHGLSTHILERCCKSSINLVCLFKGNIRRGSSWSISVVDGRVPIELLVVSLLNHLLQDLG